MNAFDFVVTIALGSILSSVILDKKIPLAEGLCAIAVLIILQYVISFISVRSKNFKYFISSAATLLFYKGELLHTVLKKERITVGEVDKAVRDAGYSSYCFVENIILEPTGDITVIGKSETMNENAMCEVEKDLS